MSIPSLHLHDSFSGSSTSPMSMPSRECLRRSPSIRRPQVATRAPRWAPSPRSTTTCARCTPGSATPTAPSAVSRQTPRRIVDLLLTRTRGPVSTCWPRSSATAMANTPRSSVGCPPTGSAGSGWTGRSWRRLPAHSGQAQEALDRCGRGPADREEGSRAANGRRWSPAAFPRWCRGRSSRLTWAEVTPAKLDSPRTPGTRRRTEVHVCVGFGDAGSAGACSKRTAPPMPGSFPWVRLLKLERFCSLTDHGRDSVTGEQPDTVGLFRHPWGIESDPPGVRRRRWRGGDLNAAHPSIEVRCDLLTC